MTVLASYSFPAGTGLSNVKVRGFAFGRYKNNTGANQNLTFTAVFNGITLVSQAISVPASTQAQAWNAWLHVGFGKGIVAAGGSATISGNLDARISNASDTGTFTGSYVAANILQTFSNSYSTFVNSAALNLLTFNLNSAGVANEVLEIDIGYLEAL